MAADLDFSMDSAIDDAIGGLLANNVIAPTDSFYFMVRSANVLLKSIVNSDIYFVAKNQAYPRIGLILSAAKTKKGNLPLFPLGAASSDYDARYDAVIEQIDLKTGIYASGIRRVAAFLTASVLTRNIPLQSSIQQVSAGDMMEKQALEDLDRIITLYDENTESELAIKQSLISIFITLGIDASSLTETAFDTPDPNAPLDTDGSKKVSVELIAKTYKTIPEQGGRKAYCWYYITGTNEDRPTQPQFTEGIFEVKVDDVVEGLGWTSEETVEALADRINTGTLGASSNILVAPNKGPDVNQKVSFYKKRFFPNTTSNINRRGSALVDYRINYLGFDVRRYSNTVQRELIIISFYTVETTDIPSAIGTNLSSQNPLAIAELKSVSTIGIKGLWYGSTTNYTSLDERGPQSIIIQVEKTHSNAIASTGASASDEKEKDLLLPNTFYFRQLDPLLPMVGTLKWRVSSTPTSSQESAVEGSISIPVPLPLPAPLYNSEDLALEFLKSLFDVTEQTSTDQEAINPRGLLGLSAQSSSVLLGEGVASESSSSSSALVTNPNQGNNILGALVHPNAVQIVPFRSLDFNSRAIVDIIEVPSNLQIATGTPLQLKSPYTEGRRSVVVEAIPLRTKLSAGSGSASGSGSKTDSEIELLDKIKASAEVIRGNRSQALQAVYDRMDFLNLRGR